MPTYGLNPVASTIPPWAVDDRIGTTAGRYALDSVLMPRTDSGLSYIDYRSGVMASGDGGNTHLAMVVNPGSGMRVTVAQGNCVINTANQGAYMCCLDSQKTVTIPASSGTTQRYDLVIARVHDDNNSALGSPSGTRQLTVEVVQGDGVTSGRPSVPTPPAGGIPLASVYVAKSASSLTGTDPYATAPYNARVKDLRGPGLVARGGMRSLYGTDAKPGSPAYDQAGAYPGDQRWVHTSGFQHQVYYGANEDPHRGGWRGVHNALVYNANPNVTTELWDKTVGRVISICSLTIPYDYVGNPFMIYPTGRTENSYSKGITLVAGIVLNDVNGQWVNWGSNHSFNAATDTTHTITIPPIMWGPFYEDLTVHLVGMLRLAPWDMGWGRIPNRNADTLLSVTVYPSTVQPPDA